MLVLFLAILFLFFISESLSGRTDVRSKYPHGVVSHQRDSVMEGVRFTSASGDSVLQTGLVDRQCDEWQQSILRIGCFVGPL